MNKRFAIHQSSLPVLFALSLVFALPGYTSHAGDAATDGMKKAMARSRKRAEMGLCTKEESEAFCAKASAALQSHLDKQAESGESSSAKPKAQIAGASNVISGFASTMVDEVRFTNPNTDESVSISSAYLDEISPWLEFHGIKYDPWGDFDRDGASNYAEYLAGTDPFDATHTLRITGFRASAELHEITFEYVGGHLYGVLATPDLTKPVWLERKVRPTPDGEDQAAVLPSAESDDVGETTIYVVPARDKPSEFFTLVPK